MFTLTIPRRSRSCESCQEKLNPGSEYTSVITDHDKEGELLRHDFCFACWDEERIEEHRSFWKGKVPERKSFSKDPEGHYQEVLECLRDEMEKNTEEAKGFAFVLALYLTRKKQLTLRQEMEMNGEQNFIYEILNTEEMLCIKNVTLSLEEMQKIQQTLTEKFQS